MAMTPETVIALVVDELLPLFKREKEKNDRIDRWARWNHDEPHKPSHATTEYKQLADRAQAPWGDLVVTSIAQTLYVEGYRRPDEPEDATGWEIWQANKMDARQVALHRAALTYGLSYGLALPGTDPLTGDPMPSLRGFSPREMIAVYDDVAVDDWPEFAMRIRRKGKAFEITVYDATDVYTLSAERTGDADRLIFVGSQSHNVGVCPVVRYKNRFDLEGRAAGEVEPFIPVLGSIDQTKFDRLVVQRFASWVVRTIAGMSLAETTAVTGESAAAAKIRLMVSDILTAEDKDTKFGSLPATQLDGFIKAHESDLTDLAATSQTPAFELLGQMANLSAEALAAAKASQTAKADERKHTFGEDHEQLLRLACHIKGDAEGAADFKAQVRWADTSIRSLSQAVDALGKMAQMLGFPPELLWAKVPGFTQLDVDEAKVRLEAAGGIDALIRSLGDGQTSPELPAA